jgi:hypothetical protein
MRTLLTPKQHRILAANLLKTAGKPGHPTKKRAKDMAQRHETMAKMIEHRDAMTPEQHRIQAADYLNKAGTNAYLTHKRARQLAEDHMSIAAAKQAKLQAVLRR